MRNIIDKYSDHNPGMWVTVPLGIVFRVLGLSGPEYECTWVSTCTSTRTPRTLVGNRSSVGSIMVT